MSRNMPEKATSPSPTANHVTLFSNGIGHFRRVYKISGGKQEKISIPFKRDHVSDVLASLSVFGNVKYDSPPSFTPTNSNATALTIDPNNAMRGLLKSLLGASVTVKPVAGRGEKRDATLTGIESQNTVTSNGHVSSVDYLVLTSEGSVTKVAMSEVESVHFNDESVRSEIEKALKNSFQKIKPDSTFLDLSLSGLAQTDERAVVQYTVPVAAWKMRYNIRTDNGVSFLEGTAIIDNNTDEDWDNFVISVVTGNPISFSTDLAEIKVPGRARINLVETSVQGAVQAEEGYGAESYCAPASAVTPMSFAKGAVARQARGYTSTANCAQFGLERLESVQVDDTAGGMAAAAPGVETKEVGDFCVFTSKEPITIASKRSAVVPMFTVPLTKSGSVLLYKERDHQRRPWRAVKFKNETEFSLGRGKVVIYQDGVFSGECVLEAAKPGENRMLPHCLENGVKIVKEVKPQQHKINSMRLSHGMFFQETVHTAVSTYTVENKKDEEFNLSVEHSNQLSGGVATYDGVDMAETEKITDGVRLYFKVPANKNLTLTVTETWVQETNFGLNGNFNWLQANVVNVKHPLASDAGLRAAADLQYRIDLLGVQIKDSQTRKNELVEQAERVRENLRATKDEAASQIRTQWVTDLDDSEKEIRKIDKVLVPELQKRQRELALELSDMLKQLTAAWKA